MKIQGSSTKNLVYLQTLTHLKAENVEKEYGLWINFYFISINCIDKKERENAHGSQNDLP